MTGFVNVKSGDPNALKIAIAKHGPVSISIDASHKTFSFYSNGVYYEPSCGKKLFYYLFKFYETKQKLKLLFQYRKH